MSSPADNEDEKKGPLHELTQPFVDLVRAPRVLWGVNVSYLIEGFVYFGMLGYLTHYFTQYAGLSDTWASPMVGVLTWGITLSMFFLGGLADRWGVRTALLAALCSMLVGRIIMALSPSLGLAAGGLFSPMHLVAMGGIFFIVVGYGMYQPAAYAAVRQFTTPKTAAMGYAMLYALMNLGGWLPSFFSPIRKSVGIAGSYWVYVGFTTLGLIVTMLILSRAIVRKAIAEAKAGREAEESEEDKTKREAEEKERKSAIKEPFNAIKWLKNHPLADAKFAFFIFALIPVQTLFAHNWLTLPKYVQRAYSGGWVGDNFEVAVNFNPLLIFILVPIVTALTQKRKIYTMVLLGTFVMAAPTFLLALGTNIWTLLGYLIIMTIGEAMWQPRFLQYAAEIAPEGRTGAYMGVAQFPWFLTKVITSVYAGWMLGTYCPAVPGVLADSVGVAATMVGNAPPIRVVLDPPASETMWFYYGLVAISSTFMLLAAKPWLAKDFKEKAE